MTPAQAAEGMAEALARIERHGWTREHSAQFGGFVRCKCGATGDAIESVQHADDDCPTAIARAALSAYEQAKGQGTAWRREAPTEDGWYPFRHGGGLTVVARVEGEAVYFSGPPPCFCGALPLSCWQGDGAVMGGEWGPRIDLDASPIPAAQVVEARNQDPRWFGIHCPHCNATTPLQCDIEQREWICARHHLGCGATWTGEWSNGSWTLAADTEMPNEH